MTMEKGIVASRGLSQITNLGPPGGPGEGGWPTVDFWKRAKLPPDPKFKGAKLRGPGGQSKWPGVGCISLFKHGISCTKQSSD